MILDHAETVELGFESRWDRSQVNGDGVVTSSAFEGRTDVSRSFRLRWNNADPSTTLLVREHFTNNLHGSFLYTPPTDGPAQSIEVIYDAAPRFTRRTPRATAIQITLRQAR